MQYRERNAMHYELECSGAQLNLRVAPRDDDDERASGWRIEARLATGNAIERVEGAADTRSEALLEVSRQWREAQARWGLPAFDWKAVAAALAEVRAL